MKTDKSFINKLSFSKKNTRLISISSVYSMFEARRRPEFYFEGECHAPWEMVYVIDGQAGTTADDRVYTLSAGEVIFHKPMEFHKIWSADGTSPRVLICSFDLDGNYAHRLRNGVYKLWDEPTQIMDSLLKFLHNSMSYKAQEINELNFFDLLSCDDAALQITVNYLELILLMLSCADKREHFAEQNEKMRLYTEIAGILENHVYSKITIEEIAQMCGVSPATVKNCFSSYAGCGVHKYLLNIKMRTATELLKEGKTVSEVSDLLQFANPNYFSYVFKRETGTCASKYKK